MVALLPLDSRIDRRRRPRITRITVTVHSI